MLHFEYKVFEDIENEANLIIYLVRAKICKVASHHHHIELNKRRLLSIDFVSYSENTYVYCICFEDLKFNIETDSDSGNLSALQ